METELVNEGELRGHPPRVVKIKLKTKKICAVVVVPGGADHFHNKRSSVHTHPLKYVDILNFGLGLVNSLS